MRLGMAVAVAALFADLAHRASHAPWECGPDCPWPWHATR